jgi:hypothetical protein
MAVEKEVVKQTGKGVGVYTVIVDDCDAGLLQKNWGIKVDRSNVYVHLKASKKVISLHREVMALVLDYEIPDGYVVDHINGNGLDNRRENLRLATKLQNSANKRKEVKSSSGYRGVYYHKRAKRYEASITIHLGYFDTAEDAHEAYKKAHIGRHGEFSPYYEEAGTPINITLKRINGAWQVSADGDLPDVVEIKYWRKESGN